MRVNIGEESFDVEINMSKIRKLKRETGIGLLSPTYLAELKQKDHDEIIFVVMEIFEFLSDYKIDVESPEFIGYAFSGQIMSDFNRLMEKYITGLPSKKK